MALSKDSRQNIRFANEFLAKFDYGLKKLADGVTLHDENSALLLVGSVAEGLANDGSDIDLMILGGEDAFGGLLVKDNEFQQTITRLPGGRELNVEFWDAPTIRLLATRLQGMYAALANPESVKSLELLSEQEIRLVHRVRNGITLRNQRKVEEWRAMLGTEYFPEYLIVSWISYYMTFRKDALAQCSGGDADTALLMMRMAMEGLAAALLAAVGETHPYLKWRPTLLKRHADVIGKRMLDRMLSFCFPARTRAARKTITEAFALADKVVHWILSHHQAAGPALQYLASKIDFGSGAAEVADTEAVA